MSDTRTISAELEPTGFKTLITNGKHSLIADEPESLGGTDLGPAPYELLASGLAACTVITVRMYATVKKWELEGIKINVSHRKELAEDGKTNIDVFTREIEFIGDLDEKQHERMLIIANKCPVHKTLSASSKIETTHVHS